MFTFDQAQFWKQLGGIDRELRKEIVSFGLQHLARSTNHVARPSDFEEMYFRDVEAAHLWQEEWSDENDDDEFLALLELIRRLERNGKESNSIMKMDRSHHST